MESEILSDPATDETSSQDRMRTSGPCWDRVPIQILCGCEPVTASCAPRTTVPTRTATVSTAPTPSWGTTAGHARLTWSYTGIRWISERTSSTSIRPGPMTSVRTSSWSKCAMRPTSLPAARLQRVVQLASDAQYHVDRGCSGRPVAGLIPRMGPFSHLHSDPIGGGRVTLPATGPAAVVATLMRSQSPSVKAPARWSSTSGKAMLAS